MTIQVLTADVAAKIAAGEVVERPANVAKELLENSLDAGATEIRVEIRQGGQRLLRVSDNGHGIAARQAPLALQRHATSKLRTADDLNHIATFGFRGEALYSIAAVSHLSLSSRHQSESFGTQLRVEGGQLVSQSKAGLPVGTIVTVEHLFYNVPARKKFLRQPATETGHISAIVQRYALAHPQLRFSLVNEDRLVFQSTGSGDILDVLTKIYGLESAKQMVPIGRARAPEAEQPPGAGGEEVDFMAGRASAPMPAVPPSSVTVSGYVGLPTLTRANRSNIDLFVNRRYIEDRSLTHAVVQAFHTFLPVGRYPIAVVLVEVDPGEVDVNVHPRKTEVRFRDGRKLYAAVQKAVRRVVVENAPVPGMSLPGQSPSAGEIESDGERWPDASAWADRRNRILNAGQPQREMDLFVPPSSGQAELSSNEEAAQPPGEDGGASEPSTLPPLRVVGQAAAMYVVAEGPEGLYLIDQHAAHERIMYEKFMAQRYGTAEGEVARQGLLEPLTLHVGDERAGLVAQHLDELDAIGFGIEPFGGDTFLVRSIPGLLSKQDPQQVLEDILQGLDHERNLVGEELEAQLVKMVCKRASIKAGQILSDIEMKELVRQLEACQSPRTCPHGRPTMIQLSAGELEKAFKRT